MECGICGKGGFRSHGELIAHIQREHMNFWFKVLFVQWGGKRGGK